MSGTSMDGLDCGIFEISLNSDANLQMSKEYVETLTVFQEVINTENTAVVDLYKTAKKNKYSSDDGESATIVSKVEDPAEVLSS